MSPGKQTQGIELRFHEQWKRVLATTQSAVEASATTQRAIHKYIALNVMQTCNTPSLTGKTQSQTRNTQIQLNRRAKLKAKRVHACMHASRGSEETRQAVRVAERKLQVLLCPCPGCPPGRLKKNKNDVHNRLKHDRTNNGNINKGRTSTAEAISQDIHICMIEPTTTT